MSTVKPIHDYYAVIMAGGGGTRLWPLSRQSRPKQTLELIDHRSLFKIAVDRLNGLFPPERIFVVTIKEQANQLIELCPQIPKKNYIIEPFPKGTASVVGLAAIALKSIDENGVMAVLTADHFIQDVSLFQTALRSGYEISKEDYLVTLGIQPTFPSTGYGYIQRGSLIGEKNGLSVYRASRFKEKPALEEAKLFLQNGDHDWNSGMFVWKISRILKEIERQMPELFKTLSTIQAKYAAADWSVPVNDLWEVIQPQTVDYGIMENAQNVAVIPIANLGWNDIGSWDALFEVLSKDADGNIVQNSNYIAMDTKNSIIFSDKNPRLIVTIGIENIIVVDTSDAILICARDKAQAVKAIVAQLKTEKMEGFL